MYNQKDLKYLRVAKKIADEFCNCLSPRKVGSIIVKNDRIISEGVNGNPNGILHIENSYIKANKNTAIFGRGWFYSETLKEWIKIMEIQEKQEKYLTVSGNLITPTYKILSEIHKEEMQQKNLNFQKVVAYKDDENHSNKGIIEKIIKEPTCPRYIIGCNSGEGLSICGCRHSESNSLFTAGHEARGATIYCFCGIPCVDCTSDIIHAGIVKVVCLSNNGPDYSYQSRSWLNQIGIEVVEIPESEIL